MNVLPGVYRENLFINKKTIAVRGVRIVGDAIEPIQSVGGTDRPIIDPSDTGADEYGVFLQDTGYGSLISGLTIRKALTGLAVLSRSDAVPPEPILEHLVFDQTPKGMDVDDTGGILRNSVFRGNKIGATFRAAAHWKVTQNEFVGPGAAIVFIAIAHGTKGFRLEENRFLDSNVFVDALHGRNDQGLHILNNEFNDSDLVLRHGVQPRG